MYRVRYGPVQQDEKSTRSNQKHNANKAWTTDFHQAFEHSCADGVFLAKGCGLRL